MIIKLPNEEASVELAATLANFLAAPLVMTFRGEIGAGKTTLIRALLRKLGVTGAIKSPTFSLIETYSLPSFLFHHFDLYRINDEDELDFMGFRDYFNKEAICCLEWPERAPHQLQQVDLIFKLTLANVGRDVELSAGSDRGRHIASAINNHFKAVLSIKN